MTSYPHSQFSLALFIALGWYVLAFMFGGIEVLVPLPDFADSGS